MYIGATTDDAPTPRPPSHRNTRKEYQSQATALPTAETKYRIAIQNSVLRRPIRSAGWLAKSAPRMVPIRALATVKPRPIPSRSKTLRK